MGTVWEEVKKLASDFQKAQLTSAVQRLSERNCVEVISKLISLGLIDVLYTTDGKEYITHKHLTKEIVDELISQGGKVNLTDLVQTLNVDYSHIEARILDVTKQHPGTKIVNGQLLDKTYLDNLALEVNEVLQRNGQVYLPDLVKQFDLPGDFIQEQISQRVGHIIDGRFDKDDHSRLFTDDFITQTKAKISGILSAATRPLSVATLVSHYGFPERQFFVIVDELLNAKRISGSVVGGRQASKAIFIPAIFTRMQQEWVDTFYKQNGYVEFSALRRIGVGEPESYVRKRFADDLDVIFLPNCVVGRGVIDQVEACVEEALNSNQFVDIMTLLPSALVTEDAAQLLKVLLKKIAKGGVQSEVIFGETCVTNDKFIEGLKNRFEGAVQKKAELLVSSGQYVQIQAGASASAGRSGKGDAAELTGSKSKKDDRRKRAAEGKAGGGTQGRETKTKATKKKYLKGKDGDSDSDHEHAGGETQASTGFHFLPVSELAEELKKEETFQDLEDEIVEEVAAYLLRPLNAQLEETARSVYEALISKSSGNRKQTITDTSDKILRKLENFKQYEKSLKILPNVDLQTQLDKFLVKSLGYEILNGAVFYCAVDSLVDVDVNRDLTNEQRAKLIAELPDDIKSVLTPFHASVGAKTASEFVKDIEPVLNNIGLTVRKADKKKEKSIIPTFRAELIQQLEAAEDPALVLHLAVVLLFLSLKQAPIHISGRFVPQIFDCISDELDGEKRKTLQDCQGLVMKRLTLKQEDSTLEEINVQLSELLPKVKEAAITTKKAQ